MKIEERDSAHHYAAAKEWTLESAEMSWQGITTYTPVTDTGRATDCLAEAGISRDAASRRRIAAPSGRAPGAGAVDP